MLPQGLTCLNIKSPIFRPQHLRGFKVCPLPSQLQSPLIPALPCGLQQTCLLQVPARGMPFPSSQIPYTCGYCVQQARAPFVCPEELWFLLHPCSHGSPAECVCGSPSLLPRVFASQCSHATCFYILNGIIITPFLVSHLC